MNLLQPLRERLRGDREGDAGLIAAARRGSRPAFDALARAHTPRLRGFITRQVGTQAAEDVLQETWIAGWAALPRFTGRAGFAAWLYGIAVHKCRDHQRRRAREARTETAVWQEARYAATPWEARVALQEDVRSALARLPTEQREVLDLYYYAELTLAEVATALERNLNTVKYQFYRAHTQVAQSLGGNTEGNGTP